jgi:tRNA dimethylallyltransferase
MPCQKTLIVVVGPTAVGKTETAIQLAKHFNTVIISADSRQFYREMAIGTAKPTHYELTLAKHYFINSHSITDDFNVGDFEKEGLSLIDVLFTEHDVVLLAGGSGLYIKAICDGLDDIPKATTQIRARLNAEYEQHGIHGLAERLKTVDPLYYTEVDISNPQRLIRALEVIESSGRTFSSYRQAKIKNRPFNIIKIGLNLPREVLYTRINLRVDQMIKQGLVDEANSLLAYRNLNPLNTVGYKEIFAYLDGKTDLETAIAMIKQNTRRFAKRQLTWFNKDKNITWFEPIEFDRMLNFLECNKN